MRRNAIAPYVSVLRGVRIQVPADLWNENHSIRAWVKAYGEKCSRIIFCTDKVTAVNDCIAHVCANNRGASA
jgi:hypothetical protein